MNEDVHLEETVKFTSVFFWGVYNSLVGLLARERDTPTAVDLIRRTMRAEQGVRYVEGLRKLGIGIDEPPAIKAAKYHFLSNSIGGLSLEYFRESDRKAWIRYRAPVGSYPGAGLSVVPRDIRKTVFMTWHPRNGELMGCDRLQWVLTKLSCDGHPFDEGYFIERDEPVPLEARGVVLDEDPPYKVFDPNGFPNLDADQWPRTRLLKAQRNFGHDYFAASLRHLPSLVGESFANAYVDLAARLVAIQEQRTFGKPDDTTPERWLAVLASHLTGDFSGFETAATNRFETRYAVDKQGHLSTLAIQTFLNALCELWNVDHAWRVAADDRRTLVMSR
jgi:hypothetical protein